MFNVMGLSKEGPKKNSLRNNKIVFTIGGMSKEGHAKKRNEFVS